jgi:uncharacterized protein YdaU (DUF1376 family)
MAERAPRRFPAFLLYASDFYSSTADMSAEEVGVYIRLLCQQWDRGHLPEEAAKLARLAIGKVSHDVLAKFPIGSDGQRRNPRLEKERDKTHAYVEMQSRKGQISALKREAKKRGQDWETSPLNPANTKSQPDVQPQVNHGSTAVESRLEPDVQPQGNNPNPNPNPKDREREARELEQVAFIVAAYPVRTDRTEALAQVRGLLEAGDSAEEILAGTQAIAAVIEACPSGPRNRFVPAPPRFFGEKKWRDDPEVWRARLMPPASKLPTGPGQSMDHLASTPVTLRML